MLRTLRNLGRLIRIALTLARYDALVLFERLGVSPLVIGWARILARRGVTGRPGQRLAQALAALGPSFIKFGQALSIRPDLLGEEVAADLSALQDRLPPYPAALARAAIEAELGQPVDALFQSFEETPVAAASIAQVHFAVKREGTPVAVKVLRPGIERQFERDIDLFRFLAELALKLRPALKRLKPLEVVDTFAQSVLLEMDLRMEAAAASELAANFAGDPDFRVPRVEWDLTGSRVLTLDRITGIPIDERMRIVAAGHDPQAIVAKAAEVFFKMVFRDGFFHADLHPGNLFLGDDGALIAVDFGIMGRLDPDTRFYLADMLVGFLGGDYRQVAEVHIRAGYVPRNQPVAVFAQACRAIAEPILNRPLHEISVARLLAQLFQVTETFEMETQPQLLLLQKSMLLAEGVGRCLAPESNMWTLARPLIERWVAENRSPPARLQATVAGLAARIENLPALLDQLERAAATLAEGGVRLHPDALAALGAGERRWPLWPWAVLLAGLAILLFA